MTGYLQEAPVDPAHKPVTTVALAKKKRRGDKISMLTCYDASFAALMNQCGVEVLLVGDSLGMVCQGHATTLPVTVADIEYHTRAVARGNQSAMVLADLPFASFSTPQEAFMSAAQLIRAGAHAVKIEGGAWLAETVRFLTERAIPVCVHLGLTPQSIHQLGGYRVQGRSIESAQQMKLDALALQSAGAALMLLEAIPAALAREITVSLAIPTIGIGAGPDCSGQVLVLHDMLDVYPGIKVRFVRNFMQGQAGIHDAVSAYVAAVKDGSFPGPEHCF
jgi:3-methyl-2-oxobutanoate hydroxymethyltransferase